MLSHNFLYILRRFYPMLKVIGQNWSKRYLIGWRGCLFVLNVVNNMEQQEVVNSESWEFMQNFVELFGIYISVRV